jgi:hypothetical protein
MGGVVFSRGEIVARGGGTIRVWGLVAGVRRWYCATASAARRWLGVGVGCRACLRCADYGLRGPSPHAVAEAEENSTEQSQREKNPENRRCPERDFAVPGARVLKIIVAVVWAVHVSLSSLRLG